MKLRYIALAGLAALIAVPAAEAGGLRGSPASMREQHEVAVDRDLTFIGDAAEVRRLVADGGLETVESASDFRLVGVSYPYAVPEVKLFIERLGKQYRDANGSPLVVTSLVRPSSEQPRNAHQLSVHPAGMAVDFRVPANAKARRWLESTLLQLENAGVLDVTRERFPPHYHVAVFPAAYAAYVERMNPAAKTEPAPVVEPVAQLSLAPAPAITAAAVANAPYRARFDAALLLIALSSVVLALVLAKRRRAVI